MSRIIGQWYSLLTSAPAVSRGVTALLCQFVLHRWTLAAACPPVPRLLVGGGRGETGGHTAVITTQTEVRTVHVRLALAPAGGRLVQAHLAGLGGDLWTLGQTETH